ncbi:MAG: glycosyltransferase family 2 protein [Pseudomonadota bacterium]
MAIRGEHVVLLSAMSNEGPYVLEWLAHHFALGCDELVIVTNSNTDNTDLILDRLERLMPERVKHVPNPKQMFPDRGKWHIMALRYAGLMGRVREADWLYVTDADELLNLRGADATFDDFFDAAGEADAVAFTSIAFNSNGRVAPERGLVSEQFTETASDFAAAEARSEVQLTAVKSLIRNRIEGARRPHRPQTPEFSKTGMRWINGSGHVMGPEWTDTNDKAMNGWGSRDFGQVNHYSIKSAGEFLLKVDRGDAVHAERLGASAQYWRYANRSGARDTSLVGLSPSARALYDGWLADPKLAALHAESFEKREARLAQIVKTPEGERLAREIGYFG